MVAASLTWLGLVWISRPILGSDTTALLRGARYLADCLADGSLVGCGYTGEVDEDGHTSPIGPYPLLQYPVALVAQAVGATPFQRAIVLAVCSVLAFAGAVAMTWLVLARVGLKAWWWGVLLVALSGPLLVYANATWGEMLASALLVCLVATTVLRLHPALIASAAFAAALTKETGYPYVAALGFLGLWLARRRTGAPLLPHLAWGAAGLAAGAAAASAFNVLRFGSALNTDYLRSQYRAPDAGTVIESAVGLVVAPNGGMLFFWLSATVLMAAIFLVPLYQTLSRRGQAEDAWIAVSLAAILVAIVLSLALWWAPFGWNAWGPRLTLPWVWPLLLLGLVSFGDQLGIAVARFLAARWRFVLTAIVLVITTLPHIGFLWRPETTRLFFFAETAACQPTARAPDSPGYYACLHEQMWTRKPILVDALSGLTTGGGLLTMLAVIAALVGCLAQLRDGLGAHA